MMRTSIQAADGGGSSRHGNSAAVCCQAAATMPNLVQEPIARNEAGRFDEIQFGWSGGAVCTCVAALP